MASVAGNWFVPIVGISDSALHWFSSCLSEGRPLLEEAISPFTHGVPQGVILVVIFCSHASFSMLPIILFFGISYYFYADDIQVYVAFESHDELDRL